MLIIETAIFTKRVNELLDDEQYRLLQWILVKAPDSGKIIPGSGGLRKLRWAGSGRGKPWRDPVDLLLVSKTGQTLDAVFVREE